MTVHPPGAGDDAGLPGRAVAHRHTACLVQRPGGNWATWREGGRKKEGGGNEERGKEGWREGEGEGGRAIDPLELTLRVLDDDTGRSMEVCVDVHVS